MLDSTAVSVRRKSPLKGKWQERNLVRASRKLNFKVDENNLES